MSMLENTQTRLAIVVLDACRDIRSAMRAGLAGPRAWMRQAAARRVLTAPGKAALDGPDGVNSHYTAALAQAMAEPGLRSRRCSRRCAPPCARRRRARQTPWEST